MEINLSKEILEFLKLAAILFGLFHVLFGFVLFIRTNRINSILRTSSSWIISIIGIFYITLLIFVVLLLISI